MAGAWGRSPGMAGAWGRSLGLAAPEVQQEQVRQKNWTPSHHKWTAELWWWFGPPDNHQCCPLKPCCCPACASERASDGTSPSVEGQRLQ